MTDKIATAGLDRIAFVSTRGRIDTFDRAEPTRWTELSMFYDPSHRRPFVAQVVGRSMEPGEVDRVRQRRAKTIDQAADLFDASDPGEACRKQAQEWEEGFEDVVAVNASAAPFGHAVRFDGKGGLAGALLFLYPSTTPEGATQGAVAEAFANDFGVPSRTVRYALAQERNKVELPSWCLAFIGALQHFDVEAFHAMRRTS